MAVDEPGDLARPPLTADAAFRNAVSRRREGEHDLAAEFCAAALTVDPLHVAAWHLRGLLSLERGNTEQGIAWIERSLSLDPAQSAAHCNIGRALLASGSPLPALQRFEQALLINPTSLDALLNSGIALQRLRRFEAALARYDAAIALGADMAEMHANRGVVLQELEQPERALQSYDRAIARDPKLAAAYANRGALAAMRLQVTAALEDFDRAIAIDPRFAVAHFRRASGLLLNGDYVAGWQAFQWRTDFRGPAPLWLGAEALAGKTILLRTEQGLGDTIQFCRYVPMVAALGARVVLEAPQALIALLRSLRGGAHIVAVGEALPPVDYFCPLLSLPLAFDTRLDRVPASIPYLRADADLVHRWRERLGTRTRPRVGLVWNGGFRPEQPELWAVNNRRNVPLELLEGLRNDGIEFISLQKGAAAEAELHELRARGWSGPKIADFAAELRDFAHTAALIGELDLVISVDTSTAHVAAALGKPVWLLNRFDTCWRWLRERADSPWYPTMRIYRQPEAGDWSTVVSRVRDDLTALTATLDGTPR